MTGCTYNKAKQALLCISICLLNLLVLQKNFNGFETTTELQVNDNNILTINTNDTTIHASTASTGCMSLDYEKEMDSIISSSRPIFITMPAKAAGTSMKSFTEKCTKRKMTDNFINEPKNVESFLTSSLQLPSIITSHTYSDRPIVRLAKQSTRKTLIIYLHRHETDRLKSGIKEVITSRVCDKTQKKKHVNTKGFKVHLNRTHCILDEIFVNMLIQERQYEVKYGAQDILTCDAFKSIKKHAPNFIFVDYKQASKLQKLISKHHCPELLEKPVEENTAAEKTIQIYLRNKSGTGVMQFDEWLNNKIDFFEWSYSLKQDSSCQNILKAVEKDLLSCPHRALKVTSSYIKELW